jgi:hypothetical protein
VVSYRHGGDDEGGNGVGSNGVADSDDDEGECREYFSTAAAPLLHRPIPQPSLMMDLPSTSRLGVGGSSTMEGAGSPLDNHNAETAAARRGLVSSGGGRSRRELSERSVQERSSSSSSKNSSKNSNKNNISQRFV